ncbi:heparinase II/III family protein [Gorillibacterium timonense]|uniref:heparinase II/III family protein n=1 Tax=Gorillibacterium timonense TaxID=1689269 RepID=UPI000A9DB233|nr:heparinase II/III family protein [Gorillibacterium timonense]
MASTDSKNSLIGEIVGRMEPPGLHLYASESDWEAFWNAFRQEEAYRLDREEVLSEGKRLLGSSIPELTYSLFAIFAKKGSRREYEQAYFERRRRLNTFAILSLWMPDHAEYEAALMDSLWAVCSELTWCLPAHLGPDDSASASIDLFAAETGFTLAEMSVLFGTRIPPILHRRMTELVDERLFRPFLMSGPFFWEQVEHNWSAVCAGSVGAAALLLLKDEERLAAILRKTESSMEAYLRGFGPDGACLEGLGYWNYGFGYFVYYADLLQKRSGGALDWFRLEKVRAIATFQQKCFLGGDAVVNFSDAKPHASVHLGLSRYLASRYEDVQAPPTALRADFREDHCSRWASAFRNLLWRDRAAGGRDWGPGSFYLQDAGWLISRVNGEAGMVGFAAKGGNNAEPHNHNDLGQFILTARGEVFLSDLGSGEYTKDYFREGRYSYACNGSQGHSVPVLNGGFQKAGAEHAAEVTEAVIGPQEDRFAVELKKAYACEGLDSLKRQWVWTKAEWPQLELTDEYIFTDVPENITERFVSRLLPVGGDGVYRLAGKNGLTLTIQYDPEAFLPEVTELTYRDHHAQDAIWYTLDFHARRPEARFRASFRFRYHEQ